MVPKGTPVRLTAGADSLVAPSYDLQALGEALTPSAPGSLPRSAPAATLRPAGPPGWGRWLRPLMLGLAAVWLVLLLRRILMES